MSQTMQLVSSISTFQRSIPYGACALGTGIVGAVLCASATSTAAIVMGIALAFIGSYAFIGVLLCGLQHSNDAKGFDKNIGNFMVTFATTGLAELVATVAKLVLIRLINGRD